MIISDPELDGVMTQLGDFGKYQLRQFLLQMLPPIIAGIHVLSLTFTAPVPESRCLIPQVDFSNDSLSDLPIYIPQDAEGNLDTCSKFKIWENKIIPNETVSCGDQYFYNTTYYGTSRVIEWNLVCDKRWMRALLQSLYMLGTASRAFFTGPMADRFGRKPLVCVTEALQFFVGIACAFVPNYYFYAATVALYGASGSYGTSFVLTMELMGPTKRTFCGIMYSVSYAIGLMVASFWAWLISDTQLLQIVFALHSLLLLSMWFLDESIPWLWGIGKKKEALKIAAKVVTINGNKFVHPKIAQCTHNNSSGHKTENTKKNDHAGLSALLGLPIMFTRMVLTTYLWFANSFLFFGLVFNIGTLPGNPFILNMFYALVEMPMCFAVILLLDKIGRRTLGSLLLFLSGLACLIIAFVSKGTITIALAMFAKMAVSGSYAICYNYTAEMFPTVIRTSVMGIASLGLSIAGILAPEAILLDSIDPGLPTIVFAAVAISAAFLVLFLPETMDKEMPQSMEDGENFGKGDTAFRFIWNWCHRKRTYVLNS